MGPRPARALALASVLAAVALAVPGAAAEARDGETFRPGLSLGGVELGMTRAQVLARWGTRHGICRDCRETTWYFNERPFEPEGTGVVFERGRVVHAFTVWQPEGWRTPGGLELGAPGGDIGAAYGELTEVRCAGYTALVRGHAVARSVVYVYDGELWGFGLTAAARRPCL